MCGVAGGFGAYKIYQLYKRQKAYDEMMDTVTEFMDHIYQRDIDNMFRGIVDNYDD